MKSRQRTAYENPCARAFETMDKQFSRFVWEDSIQFLSILTLNK